jgi:CheY-like chemotaxis protein
LARNRPFSRQIVALKEQMPRISEMLRASLRGDIVMEVMVDPDLRPIEVDIGELEIALLNVALNAGDAMLTGGQFTISAANLAPDHDVLSLPEAPYGYVMIAMEDTGMGMPGDVIARATEPMFTTKQLGSGTGLGLSQVASFARSSGGAVKIESQVGSGTRVTIVLPATDGAIPALPPGDGGERSEPLSGRVLLIDDNDEVLAVLKTMIDAMGLEVQTADKASTALEKLAEQHSRFDLILSDVVMPGMNGVDLAHAVRSTYPQLPVVLMSGYNDAVSASEFRILRKPIPFSELYDTVRTSLRSPH